MIEERSFDQGRFRNACEEICRTFGVRPELFLAVLLSCAVRGKTDWNRESVLEVVGRLREGQPAGAVVEEFTLTTFGGSAN
ncbi:MAG: hypothetical protein CVU61_11235 [Deltaproteobacteria bacterium HGW-Deltaproteobacteria-19]|nr:MAG: hypothetical protein CVU61_11235 [Deltaproteobacteria bacterium HGW-Deltaproteobacteria-19]